MKFLSLNDDYSSADSIFHVIPISYESNVTFGEGASKGPAAIIEASQHMEYYDEEFCVEPFEDGIHTHSLIAESDFDVMQDSVVESCTDLTPQSFPCFLGGDHATTIASVCAMDKIYEDFGVLIFDAHSDFRDSWNGSQNNHACVAKRLIAKHQVGVVGVRSMDVDEDNLVKTHENMSILKMCDFDFAAFQNFLATLPSTLYISVDVDCFDPSFISFTGTPEPGGFYWRELIPLLKEAFATKTIIGCDVVEFAPNGKLSNCEAYSLARLVYKLFSMKKANM